MNTPCRSWPRHKADSALSLQASKASRGGAGRYRGTPLVCQVAGCNRRWVAVFWRQRLPLSAAFHDTPGLSPAQS
jgi:hypothetical protein